MNLVPRSLLNLYLSTQQPSGSNQELLLVVTSFSRLPWQRSSPRSWERAASKHSGKSFGACSIQQVCTRPVPPWGRCTPAAWCGKLLCGHVLMHRNEGERCKDFQKASSWSRLPKAFSQTTVCHFASKHCVEGTPGSRLESIWCFQQTAFRRQQVTASTKHFTSTAPVQLMPNRCKLPSPGRPSQVQWDETVVTLSTSAIRSCYTEKEIQIVTSHLLLMRGGDLRHMGGGGSILLGGLKRLGGGLGRGASTAVAVISWPSIWPLHEITEAGWCKRFPAPTSTDHMAATPSSVTSFVYSSTSTTRSRLTLMKPTYTLDF